MFCGWEDDCRSSVSQAMRHRLSDIPSYGLIGLEKGDEHRAYALQRSTAVYFTAEAERLQYIKLR